MHIRWKTPGSLFFVAALSACGGGPSGYTPPSPATPAPANSTPATATPSSPTPASVASASPGATASASPSASATGATPSPAATATLPSRLNSPPPENPSPSPTPVATPAGTPTPLSTATPVIPAGVKIYLVNHTKNGVSGQTPSVTVYGATASGNVAPVQTIAGAATGLDFPQYLALDPAGDIFVSNQATNLVGSVEEFAAGANGNAAPVGTIAGLTTPEGIALDAAGNVYVAEVQSIDEYAKGTTGNAPTPLRSIGAPANAKANLSGLAGPYGLRIDAAGNLYVAQEEAIDVFGPTQVGNVAPVQSIAGMATLFASALDVAVDSAGDIYCVNYNLNTINEYAPGATGDAQPTNVITSPNLNEPTGIAIDKSGNLYVANYGNDSIVVIPSGTTGAATGTVISGALTGIDSPYGIAVQ